MTQSELRIFIQNRHTEKTNLLTANQYLSTLLEESAISSYLYDKMTIVYNNRFAFLERSIIDHEKLIKH